MPPGVDQLKHIVVLMMENRSFDHMFGYLKKQDPKIDGLNGDETNPDTTGAPAPVAPLAAYQAQLQPDPGHHFEDVKLQIYGDVPGGPTMKGFVKAYYQKQNDVAHSREIMYCFAPEKKQLPYYGLGNSTLRTREALYEMREVVAGMNGLLPFGNSGFGLFGELNGRSVEIRPHNGGTAPSIEQLYTNTSAPGLTHQPGFFQAGEGTRFGRTFKDHLTLDYSATFQQFVAGGSTDSFRRLNLDFSHEILIHRHAQIPAASTPRSYGPDGGAEVLDKHHYVQDTEGSVAFGVTLVESFVPSGHVVPFYFQPTLGGTDINGDRSLPSYPDYRFRAPNVLLFHASVEHSIWGPFGLELMTNYGRAAVARGDLALDHFHHSFAAGLTIHAGGFPQVSILFAWGGGEGTHTIGYISPGLLGGSGRPSIF